MAQPTLQECITILCNEPISMIKGRLEDERVLTCHCNFCQAVVFLATKYGIFKLYD